jgi:hypothetical protein
VRSRVASGLAQSAALALVDHVASEQLPARWRRVPAITSDTRL